MTKPKPKTKIGDMQVRAYLSGPMRGLPDFNYPMFHEVEQAWLEQHPHDIVLNPARNFDGDTSLPVATYFQKDLEQVLSANMIILLPGWEDSEGSSQYEVPVGRITGKIFYLAKDIRAVTDDGTPGERVGWDFEFIDAPKPKPAVALGTESIINEARMAAGLEPFTFDEADLPYKGQGEFEPRKWEYGFASIPIPEIPDEPLADWERELLTHRGPNAIRTFESGATRDQDTDKLDYEGFLSPYALRRFAEYMHQNRYMKDGSMRASDNWQKGIPREAYMKSMFRHFMDVWTQHRGAPLGTPEMTEALCGVLFNAQGYLDSIERARSGNR